MARDYYPFSDQAEALIRQPHEHISTVTVEPSEQLPFTVADFELKFDECTVNIDESNQVLYTVTMSGPAPTSTSQLEALSELAPPRLKIEAGYRWPNGDEELEMIATVFLRTIDFENGRYTLTAASGEALAADLDYGDFLSQYPNPPGTFTLNDWLMGITSPATSPYSSIIQPGLPTYYNSGQLTGITYERGVSAMQLIVDVAGRFGLWIHTVPIYTRLRTMWTIEPKPEPTGSDDEISLTLNRGAGGVATSIKEFRTREEFYNRVVHTWWWKNGDTDFDFTAYADAAPGSGYELGGTTTYYQRINAGVTADGARESVRAKLRNMLSRSKAFEIEAVSAYWLTPGKFVDVSGTTGPVQTVHVRRVSFNLVTHEMVVATRMPNVPDNQITSSI